jgi:hypothetical protein
MQAVRPGPRACPSYRALELRAERDQKSGAHRSAERHVKRGAPKNARHSSRELLELERGAPVRLVAGGGLEMRGRGSLAARSACGPFAR